MYRTSPSAAMPKCTPARVTLLTGQYPFRHGWTNHWDVPRWGAGCHFDPELHRTLPQMFQQAGYSTAAAGKWQVNDFRVQPDAMARHGFDDWAMWTGYETGNPPSGERYQDPYINTPEGSKTYQGEYGPDIYTGRLIEFMRKNKVDKGRAKKQQKMESLNDQDLMDNIDPVTGEQLYADGDEADFVEVAEASFDAGPQVQHWAKTATTTFISEAFQTQLQQCCHIILCSAFVTFCHAGQTDPHAIGSTLPMGWDFFFLRLVNCIDEVL